MKFITGVGLNLNALPMNPAIVAAALNQWGSAMGGLLNGMQNQGNNDQVRAQLIKLIFKLLDHNAS